MSTCVRGAGPCALCGVAVWRALVCSAVSGGAVDPRPERDRLTSPDGARALRFAVAFTLCESDADESHRNAYTTLGKHD